MGSATTQALATTTAELKAAKVSDLTVARELFTACLLYTSDAADE